VVIPIIYTDEYLKHQPDGHHVENPDRVKRVLKALEGKPIIKPIKATEEDPKLIHDENYVELVKLSSMRGIGLTQIHILMNTHGNPHYGL
jgi:acetoin utilization deacetylase AcuC-like enzyme